MTLPVMKNYINDEWVDSNTTTFGDVWNPAKGEKIAQVPYGTKEDVDAAVKAAKAAFPEWRATPPLSRARYLFRLKDAFEENFEEIAEVLTTEHGKAIDEARGVLRVYADKASGRLLGSEMIAPRGEHLGHLLAWAIEQRMTVGDALRMPFYHPVIEGALKAALSDVYAKIDTKSPGPVTDVAPAVD